MQPKQVAATGCATIKVVCRRTASLLLCILQTQCGCQNLNVWVASSPFISRQCVVKLRGWVPWHSSMVSGVFQVLSHSLTWESQCWNRRFLSGWWTPCMLADGSKVSPSCRQACPTWSEPTSLGPWDIAWDGTAVLDIQTPLQWQNSDPDFMSSGKVHNTALYRSVRPDLRIGIRQSPPRVCSQKYQNSSVSVGPRFTIPEPQNWFLCNLILRSSSVHPSRSLEQTTITDNFTLSPISISPRNPLFFFFFDSEKYLKRICGEKLNLHFVPNAIFSHNFCMSERHRFDTLCLGPSRFFSFSSLEFLSFFPP